MIMGAKTYANADEALRKQIKDILPENCQIEAENIAAYRLSYSDKCYCQSVINDQTGLISKNELDSASDALMRMFNSLYMYYAKTLTK